MNKLANWRGKLKVIGVGQNCRTYLDAYKIQIVQALKPDDERHRKAPSLPPYNPTGFFLLELCEGPVIPFKFGSVVELRARINTAVAPVTPHMLGNTWREIEYRLDILRAINVARIEMY
jgi:hypothetical protein